LIVGALALTGMPPFGLFLSEFTILNAAFGAGNYVVAGIALAGLFVVFGALLHHFQPMLAGKPPLATPGRRPLATELTVLCLCAALLLLLGVQVPWLLSTLLQKALAVLQ
jgi:hydrogenase-4 component F